MPDILSQNQIDELLSQLSSGKVDISTVETEKSTKKIKLYDFSSPRKLSKDNLRNLSNVFELYARHISSYLSGLLRAYCNVELAMIEEQRYAEYNNALPDSVLVAMVDFKPLDGIILMEASRMVIYTLIDRLLGGSGSIVSVNRDFTEIEIGIMERIYRQFSGFMQEAFVDLVDGTASLSKIETNARMMQVYGANQMMIIVVLNVTLDESAGTLTICIPWINLENILSARNLDFKVKSTTENTQMLMDQLKSVNVMMNCILGQTTLTLNEIVNLQAGDVLRINKKADECVTVMLGEKPLYYGRMGLKKNRMAVVIKKTHEKSG